MGSVIYMNGYEFEMRIDLLTALINWQSMLKNEN